MGTVIAVVSGKGGTGKTSLVANTGLALARMGLRVLCLDCDIGLRNLDLALGLSDRAMMDFTDVIAGRCTLEEAVTPHPAQKGLYLLTAPVRLDTGLEPRDFCRLMDQIRPQYDYCLVDAGAGLGEAFRLAAAAADRAIVVTTTDPTSLRDAQRTVMELDHLPRGRVHMVVNRCRKKLLRTLRQTLDDAIDAAGLPLLGVVPEDEEVPLALGRGIPLLLTFNHCAAVAYTNIARRITGQRVPLMRLR